MVTTQNPARSYHEYLGPAIFAPCARITLGVADVRPTERVLDVACGTGIVTKQVRAARVVGLDINPAMLAIARETEGVEWVEGSGTAMPLSDSSFDVVLCQQGLQFFPDRAAGAREMRRVLAPGGRAVVACWLAADHQAFFGVVVRAQAKLLGVSVDEAGVPFTFGDAGALRDLLVDAGFANVEVTTHAIDARFPEPERFMQMCTNAALAVMPERFGGIDPVKFADDMMAECAKDLALCRFGDELRFRVSTNVAHAR